MKAFKTELWKLLSLPGIRMALLIGVIAPALIAALDSLAEKGEIITGVSTRLAEIGYIGLALGVQGAIVLGVLAVSSEYRTESSEADSGKQITTSLTAVPARLRYLLAKACAVAMISLVLSVAAILTTVSSTMLILGDHSPAFEPSRLIGAVCYWVLTALLAMGITLITRSGIIPLAILIINSSLVSFSFILSKVTPLAYYLPDRAGADMFMLDRYSPPLTGGLVMLAWVVVIFGAAAILFLRRDIAS